ncbi:MAG: DUF3253 domain-containing protein [Alphaproteobacteria bacterium]
MDKSFSLGFPDKGYPANTASSPKIINQAWRIVCDSDLGALESPCYKRGMDEEEEKRMDPVAEAILDQLASAGADKSLSPMDVAKTYAEIRRKPKDPPELWRRYLTAVKQQALGLARTGQIEITRKGEPVDLKDFKGVIRLRLPREG